MPTFLQQIKPCELGHVDCAWFTRGVIFFFCFLSAKPKRTLTSKLLIALLRYGGVKEEFFMELLENAIEGAKTAHCDYEDALNIAFVYADMEDSISARMILSGIPLEDAYLQSRLAIMAQQERKGIKQGKLPISDCFYLMGTTDPTGKLKANEVCVILENGPYCGNVLVYKHPGLHFGDIHVLTSRYIKDIQDAVGYSRYAILFPTSGPRSLADEMANSDFDGDMYWVSINEQLLKQFKPSKPWEWGQVNKPVQAEKKCLLDLDEPLLERSLFHEFLKARFARSNALGTAADSWLVYMDRLLTDGVDEDESNVLEKKIKKLVDLYYLALDAPKAGTKINVPAELTPKKYPHYMDRKESYHSTSILGKIYDEAEKKQSEKVEPVEILLDPCFTERAASSGYKYLNLWAGRYQEYLSESGPLIDNQDKEETDLKFKELYQKYKYMLYDAAEFEQTQRNLDEVFDEACTIYQIVYEKAARFKKAGRCGFVWNVAGRALCRFYALEAKGDKVLVPLTVARNLTKKRRR